jgi:hypothetical protein
MLYFDGLIVTMNPFVKPWEIWAWRTTAGWENDDPWYPDRATILLALLRPTVVLLRFRRQCQRGQYPGVRLHHGQR